MKALLQYLKNNRHICLALYLPVFLAAFFIVENLVPPGGDYWVSYLPVDDLIPFVPCFVLPYCLWYPFMIGTGLWLMLRDGKGFTRYMYFVMSGFTAALLFCLLLPNGQDLRPASFEYENVFTRLISILYTVDTNTNVFPSMHVIGCAAAVFAAFKSPELRRVRWMWLALAVLICASTVLIKQHSVLDIFGAAAFVVPLYIFIYVLPGRKERRGREI